MRTASRALCALAPALLLSSCIGFQQKWNEAREAFPAPQQDLRGVWEGRWTSGHNGHSGELRCVVTERQAGTYEFAYRATWAQVLSGNFTIECEVEETDGSYSFSGTMDLGALGGEFSHEGEGDAAKLSATWESAGGDHGTFELKRPAEGDEDPAG